VGHADELNGRVVIVFGAGSSGTAVSNGEAAALAYARAGAAVAVVDRSADEAVRVAKEIGDAGGTVLAVTADVTRDADVAAAVAAVRHEWGTPDVLHNNVGDPAPGAVPDLGPDDWNAALTVNLTSAYLTCHHALPHMLAAGRGVIVNVSSVAGIRDTGYVYPAYSAAKAGVNQLTVSIALTYAARGIRANAILPGLIDTPMGGDLSDREIRDSRSPTGRMGSPHDVANAAVFLASDRAAYINGVCLPVDGGLTARCV
jgi:NAD(P)-dependent dehydrogenase (short-subunit alcohol dehydrogenase family)